MSGLDKITNELKDLGYSPFSIDTPKGQTVVISYCISAGKYKNQKILLGFSLQEDSYPEYPPHWIHISPPHDDQKGGSVESYKKKDDQGQEREWLTLSRPPKDFWDNLSQKNMKCYLDWHISRFCKGLK